MNLNKEKISVEGGRKNGGTNNSSKDIQCKLSRNCEQRQFDRIINIDS